MSRRVPADVRARVRARFGDRCAYCLAPQWLVHGWLEVEHIRPRADGGTDDERNLCLSCEFCNVYKAARTYGVDPVTLRRVRLFNPRRQRWSVHFRWDGERLVGRTAVGRATVVTLRMNNFYVVQTRRAWMAAGWHPPTDPA